MVVITSVFLGSLLALASANPTSRTGMILRSKRSDAPAGFAHQGAAPAEKTIPLRIALAQKDIAGLEKALYDVSTPKSANYGKHLSKQQVEEYIRPAQESVDAVNNFLELHSVNATSLSPTGDWLGFSVPVSKANEMFDADFSVFKHVDSGEEAIRTLSYSIPSSLQGHLEVVHPTTTFINGNGQLPIMQAPLKQNGTATTTGPKAANVPAECGTVITPACLQGLYGLPTTKASKSSNKIGVAGYGTQYAQQADLTNFLAALRPDLDSSTKFTLDAIDGGSNPQDPSKAGVEANLDIQYTVGVASGVPVNFIIAGDQTTDGFAGFLDMANHLLAMDSPPQVLTTSYGFDETGIDSGSARNLCNAYMQLGARGISVLFASGDSGVGGASSGCSAFVPTFPSSCPYVTSVGATTGTSETAASFSGGGFSNIFSPPDYQKAAVSAYISSIGSANSGKFNASGRGAPDISAQGTNVEIYSGGKAIQVGGTSCSSPIFAATIGLINDELAAAGKSPLGFINPLVYANPGALNDITSGDNPGCGTNGFAATKGWDPATGLGTPKYGALKSAAGL